MMESSDETRRPNSRKPPRRHAAPATLKFALVAMAMALTLATCLPPAALAQAPSNADSESLPLNLGEETESENQIEPPSVSALFVKTIGALALVLGLILLFAWLAKRHMPSSRRGLAGPDAINIMAIRSVGPRRSLIVARVRGRNLLLGSTPSAITRLADLDMPPGSEHEENDASFESELAAAERGE